MLFSTKLRASDIAETVCRNNTTTLCGKTLRIECEQYNSSVKTFYENEDELIHSYKVFKNNRPKLQNFLEALVKQCQNSNEKQLVCSFLSPMAFLLILGDAKIVSFTIRLTKFITNVFQNNR